MNPFDQVEDQMKESEAKKIIGKNNWTKFLEWMSGQTVGIYPDGSTNWYDYDVNKFARGNLKIYD